MSLEDTAKAIYDKLANEYEGSADEYYNTAQDDMEVFAEVVLMALEDLDVDMPEDSDKGILVERVAELLESGGEAQSGDLKTRMQERMKERLAPQQKPTDSAKPAEPWYTEYLKRLLGLMSDVDKPDEHTLRGNTLTVNYNPKAGPLHPKVWSQWSKYTRRRGISTLGTDKYHGKLVATVIDTRELPNVGQMVDAIQSKTMRGARSHRFSGPVTKLDRPTGTVYVFNVTLGRDVPLMVTNIIGYRNDEGAMVDPNPIMPTDVEVDTFLKDGKLAMYMAQE